jgi:acetyl esterase/lipase
MSIRIALTLALFALPTIQLFAQEVPLKSGQVIPLWEKGAPGFEDRKDEAENAESYWVKNVHNPSITVTLPPKDKATGAAVLICPGGGHRLLVFKAEGLEAADYLSSIGVACFSLKYRLGREEGSPYKVAQHAKQDGQRAMQLIRANAAQWGIDPNRIGIMGFSAGGEVVSMVSFSPDAAVPDATDPVDRVSSHPDFQIYVYPGPLGIPDTLPENTPPTWLMVANDDVGASQTIFSLAPKLRKAKVPMEMHVYAQGDHGFNMGNRSKLKTISTWPDRLGDWLADSNLLKADGGDKDKKE